MSSPARTLISRCTVLSQPIEGTNPMTVTITRLYDDHVSAERAVRDLEAAGIPHKDISIMSNNADSWYKGGRADTTAPGTPRGRIDRDHDGVDDRAEGAGTGAGGPRVA